MGKSSSSLKKKRAKKYSSKGHKKSKSGRRSRKDKSKKIRRCDDSFSSSDEDYSRSSTSLSSSSTDDSYRERKVPSRTRKDVSGRKKRARRHSCSSESSEETVRDRKRKRSKRKDVDSDVRKKKKKKKKPRKEPSVSSTSSESQSCPSDQSAKESSDNEYESLKHRIARRETDGQISEGRIEKNRSRSRSFSPRSRDLYSGEECKIEVHSRRLKSVVIFPNYVEVDGKSSSDEMQKKGCNPGCIYANEGSISGSGKKETVCLMEIECQNEEVAEIDKGDANVYAGSIFMDNEKDDRTNSVRVEKNQHFGKETSEVGAVSNFNGNDLELVLRERALENLRKFKKDLQSNGNETGHMEEQSKAMPTVGIGVVAGRQLTKPSVAEGQHTAPSLSRDSLSLSRNTESIRDDRHSGSRTADPTRHELGELEPKLVPAIKKAASPATSPRISKVSPLRRREISGQSHILLNQSSKNIVAHVNGSSSLVPKLSSSSVSLSHNGQDELPYETKGDLQETLTQDVSHSKQSENQVCLEKNASSEQSIAQTTNNIERDLDGDSAALRSSNVKPPSKECSLNKLHDGADDSSQFESKTMQVMRGGEMVEVSYKVYIPKKAPALSRRQLKR